MGKRMHTTFISKELATVLKNYNEDFIFENYKLTYNDKSPISPTAAKIVGEFLAKQREVKLMDWIKIGRLTQYNGIMDCRDAILIKDLMLRYFFKTERTLNNNCTVISTSTHLCRVPKRSDAVVYNKTYYPNSYKITLDKKRIELVVNMDWWIVSVKSKKPLIIDFDGLVNPNKSVEDYCFEDLPKDKIYGTYSENNSQFTIMFSSRCKLEKFFNLLKNSLEK